MQTSSTDIHPTHKYALEIVNGNRISCELEKLACKRHLDDLGRQDTDDFPYVFDESRANRIFRWFSECCRHVRGPFSGRPIILEPFQMFDLGCLFGWVHKDTGRRRFKKSYNQRARGNVKSTEMSGIALYGMCSDCVYPPRRPELRMFEENPEIECAAVDKDQAKRVWGDAKQMGIKSPDIIKRLAIKRTYVEHKERSGWLRPLSKDTKNKDSGAPCIVIVDEYHAHPTSEIHDVLYSGFGKRLQSLMCIITTAGKDAENNPCKKEYEICKKMLKGELPIVNHYFIMIRELEDEEKEPHDEACWVKANPILQSDNEYSGILRQQIKDEYDEAYNSNDPDKIREFLTKRCNLWRADSEEKYMAGHMDKFKALAVSREEFLELTKGLDGWSGVDMSKRIDLTAGGFVFWLPDGRLAVTAHGFIPEEAANKHEHSDKIPYRHYAKEGWCTIIPGAVIDDEYIQDHIDQECIKNKWHVREINHDPYGARQFAINMGKKGYEPIEIQQQMRYLSEPTKKFRELVLQGRLVYDGNPLLIWCVSNAYTITDTKENIMLSKRHKDDTQRIDLLAAIINALYRAMFAENETSVYETRGMRSL